MSKRCSHPQVLAVGPVCQVERCRECKCISIHLGPTTVRMEESALASVWATLEEALTALYTDGILPEAAVDTAPSPRMTRGSA